MGSGGKGAGGKTVVGEYYMSLHLGFCAWTEGLMLREVRVADRPIWSGALTTRSIIGIDLRDLFGGYLKEGGVHGLLHVLPGDLAQVLPTGLSRRFGLGRFDCPAFRGIASLFFTGFGPFGSYPTEGLDDWIPTDPDSPPGWYWHANNPYLPPVSAVWLRPSKGLNPSTAMTLVDPADTGSRFGSNPAHMIYECLTNRDFGAGAGLESIDIVSFEAAATTLFNENHMLSVKWDRQSSHEDFINEIIDHINATLFTHPSTGKLTIKLLRADYDVNTLRVFDPSNSKIVNFQRKLWGDETANEITVTWTNPITELTETVTAQDLANIAVQGKVVSASRNYHMVRAQWLAMGLAERELAMSVSPLAACDIEADRRAYDLLTGDVVKISSPEHGINQLVMRVASVDYGKPGDSVIRASLMEDIFGAPLSDYLVPVATDDVPSIGDAPQPVDAIAVTLPAMLAALELGYQDPSGLEYPNAVIGYLIKPAPDDIEAELYGPVPTGTGTTYMGHVATVDLAGYCTLASSLPQQAQSLVPTLSNMIGYAARVGDYLLIGGSDEETTELALVVDRTEAGWLLWRGVLDTTPKAWAAGTPIRIASANRRFVDPNIRAAGDTITYRLLSRTSIGRLPCESAPDLVVTPTERPHLPLRPAGVMVEGVAFGTADATGLGAFGVAWSHRNRVVEASVPLEWTSASVSPETGQTTTIEVLDTADRSLILLLSGLTGTSQTILASSLGSAASVIVRVTSERDGLASLQGHEITVLL